VQASDCIYIGGSEFSGSDTHAEDADARGPEDRDNEDIDELSAPDHGSVTSNREGVSIDTDDTVHAATPVDHQRPGADEVHDRGTPSLAMPSMGISGDGQRSISPQHTLNNYELFDQLRAQINSNPRESQQTHTR
jgi:hypothetical protein